jgi:hypothetical protein
MYNQYTVQFAYTAIVSCVTCTRPSTRRVSIFFAYFPQKKESEAYEITSLSVCPPLITYEIQLGGHAIEGGLDAVLFNPVPLTIPKWRTFKLLRLMQNLHQSTWDHEILYIDRSSKDEQLFIRSFLLKKIRTWRPFEC